MSDKRDYVKEYKNLYKPDTYPSLVDVGEMQFVAVDGEGDPDGNDYQEAVKALYAFSYTLKMGAKAYPLYFEYVVPPLESLWWSEGDFSRYARAEWKWTAMIRLPEFVTPTLFRWTKNEAARKKKDADVSGVRLLTFTEGLCVQIMHIGPYSDEPASIAKIEEFIEENNLVNAAGGERKHHEIYLSDPRKTSPDKLKTVLRIPVERR